MHVWAQSLPESEIPTGITGGTASRDSIRYDRAKEQEEVQKRGSPWFSPTRRLERSPTTTYRADIRQKILLEAVICSTKT